MLLNAPLHKTRALFFEKRHVLQHHFNANTISFNPSMQNEVLSERKAMSEFESRLSLNGMFHQFHRALCSLANLDLAEPIKRPPILTTP